MGWIIFGVIVIVIGVFLVYSAKSAAKKALYMQALETTTVGTITETVEQIRTSMEGEASEYAEYVELKGSIQCEEGTQLIGQMSQREAVICVTKVIREYEEKRVSTDSEGRRRTSWHKGRDTVSNNRNEVPFFLEDSTGRIRINHKGSELGLIKAVEKFEPANDGGGSQISFGGLSFTVSAFGSGRRTLGYRYTEEIFPLGAKLYALGEAADTEHGLVLRKPTGEESKPYLLSLKSEEELQESNQSKAKTHRTIGLVLLALGGVLLLIGIGSFAM